MPRRRKLPATNLDTESLNRLRKQKQHAAKIVAALAYTIMVVMEIIGTFAHIILLILAHLTSRALTNKKVELGYT